MITPEQRAEILRLFYAEHWKTGTIAGQLGLHPDAVRLALDTGRVRRLPGARQTLLAPFHDFLSTTLAQYPRLRATRLHAMLRERGYTGSVSQLRRYLAGIRPPQREAFLRLDTFPGEQAQADWAHCGQVRIGSALRRLSCFVMTLSYSRALWLEFFLDQSLENFFLGHVHALTDWGGAPRVILYDNLKAVVLERRGSEVRFHPRLLELSGHYHFAARPCRPARGNEKGRVERVIQYIRDSFLAARPFTDLADFNRQALRWRDDIAHRRRWPQDDTRIIAEVFQEEQPRLLPLPLHPFETDHLQPVRSGKTIYVRFDLNDYSIPPDAAGRPLTLLAGPAEVRLLDGTREIARHPRSYDRHRRIDDPAHLALLLAEKHRALGATAGGRLTRLLPAAPAFLDAAFARGEPVAGQTRQLLGLLDDYGAAAVEAALREALARGTPRASSVAFLLQQRQRAGTRPPPVDLSRHPHLADLAVPTHQLEVYDELIDESRHAGE